MIYDIPYLKKNNQVLPTNIKTFEYTSLNKEDSFIIKGNRV